MFFHRGQNRFFHRVRIVFSQASRGPGIIFPQGQEWVFPQCQNLTLLVFPQCQNLTLQESRPEPSVPSPRQPRAAQSCQSCQSQPRASRASPEQPRELIAAQSRPEPPEPHPPHKQQQCCQSSWSPAAGSSQGHCRKTASCAPRPWPAYVHHSIHIWIY